MCKDVIACRLYFWVTSCCAQESLSLGKGCETSRSRKSQEIHTFLSNTTLITTDSCSKQDLALLWHQCKLLLLKPFVSLVLNVIIRPWHFCCLRLRGKGMSMSIWSAATTWRTFMFGMCLYVCQRQKGSLTATLAPWRSAKGAVSPGCLCSCLICYALFLYC